MNGAVKVSSRMKVTLVMYKVDSDTGIGHGQAVAQGI